MQRKTPEPDELDRLLFRMRAARSRKAQADKGSKDAAAAVVALYHEAREAGVQIKMCEEKLGISNQYAHKMRKT